MLGGAPQQKLPINIDILRGLRQQLNLTYSVACSFWAICLVAFLGMFRKSHLLVTGASSFNSAQQFTKSDFTFFPWGALVRVRWSKTIQFRERVISIPISWVPGSPFCPVTAVTKAFCFTPDSSDTSQAFQWIEKKIIVHALLMLLIKLVSVIGLKQEM